MKLSQCHPLRCPVSHDGLWCRQFPQQHFSSSFIFHSLPSLRRTWCRVLLLPAPWLLLPVAVPNTVHRTPGTWSASSSCVLLAHLPSAAYSNIRHGQLLFSVRLLLSFCLLPCYFCVSSGSRISATSFSEVTTHALPPALRICFIVCSCILLSTPMNGRLTSNP